MILLPIISLQYIRYEYIPRVILCHCVRIENVIIGRVSTMYVVLCETENMFFVCGNTGNLVKTVH